jgi:hypothetical protein
MQLVLRLIDEVKEVAEENVSGIGGRYRTPFYSDTSRQNESREKENYQEETSQEKIN